MPAFTGKIEGLGVSGVYKRNENPTQYVGSFPLPAMSADVLDQGKLYRLDIDAGPSMNVRIHKLKVGQVAGTVTIQFTSQGQPLA